MERTSAVGEPVRYAAANAVATKTPTRANTRRTMSGTSDDWREPNGSGHDRGKEPTPEMFPDSFRHD
jgi:hypothetical protein